MSENTMKYGLLDNYVDAIKKYITFSGRANRYECWGFLLLNTLISISLFALSIILPILLAFIPNIDTSILGVVFLVFYILSMLFQLFVITPSLAMFVRRLHDTNRTGWMVLLPIGVALLFMLCLIAVSVVQYVGLSVNYIVTIIISVILSISVVVSYIYLLVVLCKASVNDGNKYGEESKCPRSDKEGKKMIILFFSFFAIFYFIAFFIGFFSEYDSGMSTYNTNDVVYDQEAIDFEAPNN